VPLLLPVSNLGLYSLYFCFFPCSPSSPYQRPSLLIQHASVVTVTHECPGNPPHLLSKSMQITTSKSSRASAETELCTYRVRTSKTRGREGYMYTTTLCSYPQLCLCHAPLQKISLLLLSWFNLAPIGNVTQSKAFWKDKILCL